MSKKKRELTADEKALWRRVAATAKPRRSAKGEAVADPGTKVQSVAAAPLMPRPPSPPAPLPPAKHTAPVADRGGEKRVRRGKVEIEGTLDLHGHTQQSAFAALATFLAASRRRGARCVLVITGSGRGGEGVLKRALPDWLAGPEIKPSVAGFAQAHRQHGGTGAFYVFLKRT